VTSATPRIYVGCSLTQAPPDFCAAVEALKTELRNHYEVFEFVGLVNGTAADVYHWDVHHCVADCDLLVAICDYPSIGLGYEIAAAIERYNRPVLAVAHHDTRITRVVLGIDSPRFSMERYQDMGEIVSMVQKRLAR